MLDLGRLSLRAAGRLVDHDLTRSAERNRLPFVPPESRNAPMLAAMPIQMVDTSHLIYCIVS